MWEEHFLGGIKDKLLDKISAAQECAEVGLYNIQLQQDRQNLSLQLKCVIHLGSGWGGEGRV